MKADWQKTRLYPNFSDYDRPYLRLCEAVLDILNTQKAWFEEGEVNKESRKELACVLVSYFEDFINDIGIWQAFVGRNRELHGYYLPFYNLSPEYDTDYLNLEDFAYLIWHFITKCLDTRIYAPDHPYLLELAEDIFDLLESEIENVPAVAEFLLQHFGNKNFAHPIVSSKVDAWSDRHFYWRFYQPQEFGQKYPMIKEIDMGEVP